MRESKQDYHVMPELSKSGFIQVYDRVGRIMRAETFSRAAAKQLRAAVRENTVNPGDIRTVLLDVETKTGVRHFPAICYRDRVALKITGTINRVTDDMMDVILDKIQGMSSKKSVAMFCKWLRSTYGMTNAAAGMFTAGQDKQIRQALLDKLSSL